MNYDCIPLAIVLVIYLWSYSEFMIEKIEGKW